MRIEGKDAWLLDKLLNCAIGITWNCFEHLDRMEIVEAFGVQDFYVFLHLPILYRQ